MRERRVGVIRPVTAANVVGAAAALALGVGLAWPMTVSATGEGATRPRDGAAPSPRRYARIVSTSLVADRLLLELCEPTRIAAVSERSARVALDAHRFAGMRTVTGERTLEAIVRLRPDLVLTHSVSDGRAIGRLRSAGVPVLDLGPMRGVDTLRRDIRIIARVIGHPERGERLLARFERRLASVATPAPAERPTALYVGLHGDKLYGGARGTSLHDVLVFAGLRDVAAERFDGWPHFAPEDLAALDPEVLVTQTGMARALCARHGFHRLRACRSGRVVEVPGPIISDPGLVMLDAAEWVHEAVFGQKVVVP